MSKNIWTLFAVLALAASSTVYAEGLDGAWSLEGYEFENQVVPVSGMMIFADGHFAFVFDMELEGKSMRAHGGSYEVTGDRLVYTVPWWVEHVAGKAQVMEEERKAPGRIKRDGDLLTMSFDAGTVQKYKKNPSVAGDEPDELSGAWLMESYEGRAKTGPTTGILVFADRKFALVYTMRPSDGSLDGRGHAGSYERDGETLKLTLGWSLHVVGGETTMEEPGSVHQTTVQVSGNRLRLGFADGAFQTFRKAK